MFLVIYGVVLSSLSLDSPHIWQDVLLLSHDVPPLSTSCMSYGTRRMSLWHLVDDTYNKWMTDDQKLPKKTRWLMVGGVNPVIMTILFVPIWHVSHTPTIIQNNKIIVQKHKMTCQSTRAKFGTKQCSFTLPTICWCGLLQELAMTRAKQMSNMQHQS